MRKASRANLRLQKGRYQRWLARADDFDCLTLLWAVQALQTGRALAAGRHISFPRDATSQDAVHKYRIFEWELETIVASLLTTPKDRARIGRFHITNLTRFESLASLVNWLRAIENEEYAIRSAKENIFDEMYRIGQRQFSWQRAPNSELLFRSVYVFGQSECGNYFEETFGISVSSFLFISLGLFVLASERPWIAKPDIKQLKITQAEMDRALSLQSVSLSNGRQLASEMNANATRELGAPLKIAYMPSILRKRPIISQIGRPEAYCAPLPSLILHRATSGLFYDIASGPQRLLAEANNRFEEYVRMLIKAYCPSVEVIKGRVYGPQARAIDPPDCLVKCRDQITIAIECKATKLTFGAQFSDNPTIAARERFEQIAKGVFQLWRFFSHARRNTYTENAVSPDALGVVLTMDSWMQMAHQQREAALARARELASADPEIGDQDMRPVVFSSIQELNETLAMCSDEDFPVVLRSAVSEQFLGWGLPEVARNSDIDLKRNAFPLDVSNMLPWWENMRDLKD